jgi:hypothetical protein
MRIISFSFLSVPGRGDREGKALGNGRMYVELWEEISFWRDRRYSKRMVR